MRARNVAIKLWVGLVLAFPRALVPSCPLFLLASSCALAADEPDPFMQGVEQSEQQPPPSPAPKKPVAKHAGGQTKIELAAPFNLQATPVKRSVSLQWEWQPPTDNPLGDNFGFEVWRDNASLAMMTETSYTDHNVPVGSHTYKIRVRGSARQGSKRVAYVSPWSEPVDATIRSVCSQAPQVTLQAAPTKSAYRGQIPSLRIHLVGDVTNFPGCSELSLTYSVDTGAGISHTGPVELSPTGHFDAFIDAIRPGDEPPGDNAIFSVTVTAENDAGPTTSSAYDIQVQQQNRYAPTSF